jgi:hypothetical protein
MDKHNTFCGNLSQPDTPVSEKAESDPTWVFAYQAKTQVLQESSRDAQRQFLVSHQTFNRPALSKTLET